MVCTISAMPSALSCYACCHAASTNAAATTVVLLVEKCNIAYTTQGTKVEQPYNMHFKAQTANTQSMMKLIALPGFSNMLLHANYSKSCLRNACGNHLCIRAAKVHLTVEWYHSSSSEPALADASLLNTSSIIRRSLTPAQKDHLRRYKMQPSDKLHNPMSSHTTKK